MNATQIEFLSRVNNVRNNVMVVCAPTKQYPAGGWTQEQVSEILSWALTLRPYLNDSDRATLDSI